MNTRAVAVCISAIMVSALAMGAKLEIRSERVARAFYPGERITLFASVACPRQVATYSIYDDSGRRVHAAAATIGGRQLTRIQIPGRLPHGWYELVLHLAGERLSDAFCVIPRCYENTFGDDGLFHMQITTLSEPYYAAMALLGIRCVRTDMVWPRIEPERDHLDLAWVRDHMQLMQKYGVRLMGTFGYTPKWTRVAPANGLDEWTRAAKFTWQPGDVMRWNRYVRTVVEAVKNETVQWPPDYATPQGEDPPKQLHPFIHSWELWNEADLMFYTGSWGRYMDLLRITDCNVKAQQPETPLVYGGSTGNWYCMCLVAANSGELYFQRLAWHPSLDTYDHIACWRRGVYQLPWINGFPRKNTLNESVLQYRWHDKNFPDHQQLPGDLFRTRIRLMAWGEDSHFRSSCFNQWAAPPDAHGAQNALLHEKNGGLVPTRLFVGFAAARHWLTDAAYVGPVDLGPLTEAHVLLKDGRPLLCAWSDSDASATIRIPPGAQQITVMGRLRDVETTGLRRRKLSRTPLMILGCADEYLGRALQRRYRLYMDTKFGQRAGHTIWYGVSDLKKDLVNWVDDDYKSSLGERIARAADALADGKPGDVALLSEALAACESGMMQVAERCADDGAVPPRAIGVTYRLAEMQYWLARVTDSRACLSDEWRASPEMLQRLRDGVGRLNQRVTAVDGEPPFTSQLLWRAKRHLDMAQQTGMRGGVVLAQSEIAVAEELVQVEKRMLKRVFPVAHFPTATVLRKGRLLAPGDEHEVSVRVFNFLNRDIHGDLEIDVPATWKVTTGDMRQFFAEADDVSDPIVFRFEIPGEPEPWVQKTPPMPVDPQPVNIPPSLETKSDIRFRGRLASGAELVEIMYPVFVGELCNPPDLDGLSANISMQEAYERSRVESGGFDGIIDQIRPIPLQNPGSLLYYLQ
ncbi:MAG: hypothetical protein R6V19_12225 [Armatimonadota bacterium]